jgi:hypothetical protein
VAEAVLRGGLLAPEGASDSVRLLGRRTLSESEGTLRVGQSSAVIGVTATLAQAEVGRADVHQRLAAMELTPLRFSRPAMFSALNSSGVSLSSFDRGSVCGSGRAQPSAARHGVRCDDSALVSPIAV